MNVVASVPEAKNVNLRYSEERLDSFKSDQRQYAQTFF